MMVGSRVTTPHDMDEAEIVGRIKGIKERYGKTLVILGHHYQRREIVQLADFRGDSLELCRAAANQPDAEIIVFCGVRFMVESARVLARPDQRVFHPNARAGCPMADMASAPLVEKAWRDLEERGLASSTIPVTYMNSDADLKAFTGRHGGIVCTSSNSTKVFDWAFSRGERIIFYPDEHLGRNVANSMGIESAIYDPREPLGGLTEEEFEQSRVLLWKGFCHVHTHFTVDHIAQVREKWPEVYVMSHPECTQEVIAASDFSGSTSQMCNKVAEARPGAVFAIGTEINMIHRLAYENPDKSVHTLSRSLCPNMYRVNLYNLYDTVRDFDAAPEVELTDDVMRDAKLALDRMLAIH
ncbi:MAG: quinolinate synthase NadA [Planctomycetota bacterium]|nr:quinolinate synthase NadA [Planctomycetota bacterium]